MLVIRADVHKMLVRIATKETPYQTADLGLPCLSKSFWQANNVQNFRTLTVCNGIHNNTV